MTNEPERDRMTDGYEHVGRATCRELRRLMEQGWRAPFALDVTGGDDVRLFTAEYDGNHHFTSADGGGAWLLPEIRFPVTVFVTDAGGQTMMLMVNENFSQLN